MESCEFSIKKSLVYIPYRMLIQQNTCAFENYYLIRCSLGVITHWYNMHCVCVYLLFSVLASFWPRLVSFLECAFPLHGSCVTHAWPTYSHHTSMIHTWHAVDISIIIYSIYHFSPCATMCSHNHTIYLNSALHTSITYPWASIPLHSMSNCVCPLS